MKNKIKNRQKSRSIKRKVLCVIEVILICATIVGTYVFAAVNKINKVGLDESLLEINSEVDASKYTGFTNIALFGLDSRDESLGKGNRSDAIIVASINNSTGKIKLVSIYRDTLLDVGGGEYNKANSAYSYSGPEGAINMINKTLDLAINQYISVSFGGLATTIDNLGGLDIEMTAEEVVWMNGYIAETSEASGIWSPTLSSSEIVDGVHHLNGIQATAYCRIRYTRGDDYKRTERQRIVLEKIFEKAKTMGVKQLINIANTVFPMTQTNMSLPSLIKLGRRLLNFNITAQTGFPINKTSGYVSGAGSVVLATDLASDVQMLHKILFNEKNYTPSSTVQAMSNRIAGTETGSPPAGEEIEFSDEYEDTSQETSSETQQTQPTDSSETDTTSDSTDTTSQPTDNTQTDTDVSDETSQTTS